MANFRLDNRLEITQGATSLGSRGSGNHFEVGFFNSLGGGNDSHLAEYWVIVNAKIENVVENDDLSIDLDYYGISDVRVMTTMAKNITTGSLEYRLSVDLDNSGNLKQVWSKRADLSGSFDSGIINIETLKQPLHIHVEAGESVGFAEKRILNWYGDASLSDDEFNIYTGQPLITNLNPPLYTPCNIRKGSTFPSVNKLKLTNQIRQNGQYRIIAKESRRTQRADNTGHVRVRHNGNYLQSPLIDL